MDIDSWLLDTPLLQIVLNYLEEYASLLLFYLDSDGHILQENVYAQKSIGRSAVGEPFSNLLINFNHSFQLDNMLFGAEEPVRLHISRMPNPPETYYFHFWKLPDQTILVIGQQDMIEVERLRYKMIDLNKDLGQLTRKLHRSNKQLELLHEQKNQFFGMAVHDLRHPLTVIRMYTDFLLHFNETGDSGQSIEFLQIVRQSADHMEQILNSFLDFTVFESGHLKIEKKDVELVSWLRRIVTRSAVVAEKRNITLEFVTRADELRLPLDDSKMTQVLDNLISNACKFSPKKGAVTIHLQQHGENAVITVRDCGPGIAEADQKNLFEPFQRIHSSRNVQTTGQEKGAGLGLAIVKKIVAGHGGRVWVESSPGAGALFGVSLPI